MTRGQIAVVLPNGKILSSVEFNGDMYLSHHGKEIIEELEYIDSEEEFKEYVGKFNRENFHYDELPLWYECDDGFFDMKNDYFGKWFSDFVYIKNLSEKPVVFTDTQGRNIRLDNDTVAAFYFGEFLAAGEDCEKALFVERLSDMKSNLDGFDMSKNYAEIWNACADFDNEHRDSYLTDKITGYDFVDDELLEYIVKENATDLSRLRCFIGDTYDADIYMLDGYGNLQNVEVSDFENLLDDLISDLQYEIDVPTVGEACL